MDRVGLAHAILEGTDRRDQWFADRRVGERPLRDCGVGKFEMSRGNQRDREAANLDGLVIDGDPNLTLIESPASPDIRARFGAEQNGSGSLRDFRRIHRVVEMGVDGNYDRECADVISFETKSDRIVIRRNFSEHEFEGTDPREPSVHHPFDGSTAGPSKVFRKKIARPRSPAKIVAMPHKKMRRFMFETVARSRISDGRCFFSSFRVGGILGYDQDRRSVVV